jgi:ribonuclease J
MRDAKIEEGDVVIFSSRVIPGNEKRINYLKNKLTRVGARVIAKHTQDIHVSGHPARDELMQMYDWIRPQILVPVHGEFQHMVEHARLAKKHGIKDVIIPENGSLIRLEKGNVDIVDEVTAGRIVKDGNVLVAIDHSSIKERYKLADNGVVSISLTLGYENELYQKPQVALCGLISKGDLVANIAQTTEDVLAEMSSSIKENTIILTDRISMEIKRCVREICEKKPIVIVHINRL